MAQPAAATATLSTWVLPEEPSDGALRQAAGAAAHLPPGAAILIDFFGHPEAVARRMRELAPGRAVIDVGGAALAVLEGLLRSSR